MPLFCKTKDVDALQSKAMHGDVDAQFNLAECYYHGKGIEQDVFRAIHWYAYAASNGHSKACEMFDLLYFHGKNLQHKLMGFWFERECLLHKQIHSSVPFELKSISYTEHDDRDRAIKATVPWSLELRKIMGEDFDKYADLNSRTFVEVSLSDGHLYDSTRRGGLASGSVLSGNVSRDIALDACAIDSAIRMSLIESRGDVSLELIEFHRQFSSGIVKVLRRQADNSKLLEKVLAFSFMKGMEQRVACDVYSNTPRHSCYNFYSAPTECLEGNLGSIMTDLPSHLTKELNNHIDRSRTYVLNLLKNSRDAGDLSILEDKILAVAVVGDNWAARSGVSGARVKRYRNSDMMTMDELRKIAGEAFINQVLLPDGAQILNANFNWDFQANVLAEVRGEKRAYIVRSAVYPEPASFLRFELDRLYRGSQDNGFVPYFASIFVGSTNDEHFSDGVVLAGDGTKVMVAGCDKLELN